MANKATYNKLPIASSSTEGNSNKLKSHNLIPCNTAEEIALAMGISSGKLRFLTLNTPASTIRHYTRFKISKKTGETRSISAPVPSLKSAQKWILDNILAKIEVHSAAHGFCKNRSTVTNAQLTFSAVGEAARRVSNLMQEIRAIVVAEGFKINQDKTQILGRSVRQEVTGIVVNRQLNISKNTLKAFRATLYQIDREGLSGKTWGNSTNLIAAIAGFANYVSMVNPNKGKELVLEVDRIQQKYASKDCPSSGDIEF